MFQDNIFLQICGIIGLLFAATLLLATVIEIPGINVTSEEILPVRIILLMMVFGLIRGAF